MFFNKFLTFLLSRLFCLIILLSIFTYHSPIALAYPEAAGGNNTSPAPLGAGNIGDVNRDGKLNIFDLLVILNYLQRSTPPAEADVDGSGSVDISDLVSILNLLTATSYPVSRELEFLVTIDLCDLFDSRVYSWTIDDSGLVRPSFQVHSNKNLHQVLFVLGKDTLTATEGTIPPICDVDTCVIDTTFTCFFDGGIHPWYIKVTDTDGNWRDTSGTTKFLVYGPCDIDWGDTRIGRKIDFPLILYGPLQRFKIKLFDFRDTYILNIDLNRSRADSVVFTEIDSLANSIMEDLAQHDSVWHTLTIYDNPSRLFVSGAVDRWTAKKVDRLFFKGWYGWLQPEIYPLDDNEELMEKLGFPSWFRNIEYYFSDNYLLDYDIFEKYKDK